MVGHKSLPSLLEAALEQGPCLPSLPLPGPRAVADAPLHPTDAEGDRSSAAPGACCADFIILCLKYPPHFDTLTLHYNSLLLLHLP